MLTRETPRALAQNVDTLIRKAEKTKSILSVVRAGTR